MMADKCKISVEQKRNAKKWNKAFHTLNADATQQDIVDFLDEIHNSFELTKIDGMPKDRGDDMMRYTLKLDNGVYDTDTYFQWRVTDPIAMRFRRRMGEAKAEDIRQDPNVALGREYGTTIHEVLYQLNQHHNAVKRGEKPAKTLKEIADQFVETGEYPIRKEQFDILNQGAERLINKIYAEQERIDPNGKVVLRFEHFVGDPVKDVGGTIDVMAIYSDKTVRIYDYKSFAPKGGSVEYVGNEAVLINRNYAPMSKRDAWKEQMNGYRRILLSRYGITDVRGSQIVPIWVDFNTEFSKKDNKRYRQKLPRQIVMGENLNDNLRNFLAGTEKKGISYIDNFLASYYKRQDAIRRKWAKLSKEEREVLSREMEIIDNAIQEFADKDKLDKLLNEAVFVAQRSSAMLDDEKPLTFEDLNEQVEFFEGVITFVNTFRRIEPELSQQQKVLAERMKASLDAYTDQITMIEKVLGRLTIERIDSLTASIPDKFGSVTRDGLTINLREDGVIRQWVMQGNEQNNPIFRYAIERMQRSLSKTRAALQDFNEEFVRYEQAVEAWAAERGLSLSKVADYLLDANNNFFQEIKPEFYDLKQQAFDGGDASFFTKWYTIKKTNSLGETYEQWYERRRSEISELIERKLDDVRKKNPDRAEKLYFKEMDEWRSRHDLSLDEKGKPLFPQAWLNTIFLEPSEEARRIYRTEQFQFILDNKPLHDYYQFMHRFIVNARGTIGYDMVRQRNFFPKVRADIIEKLSHLNLSAIGDDIREIAAVREDTEDFGMLDEEGNVTKRIPIFYTNPINGEGQVSRDIGNSMRLFAKVVYNYQHMEEVEASVLAAKQVMADHVQFYETNSWGRKLYDKFQNAAFKDKGKTTTERIMDLHINYHLYGVSVDPVFGKKFTHNVMALKNYFGIVTLGAGFIPGIASYGAARASAFIEANKGLMFTHDQFKKAGRTAFGSIDDRRKYYSLAYFFGVYNDDMITTIANVGKSGLGRKNSLLKDKRYSNRVKQYVNDRLLFRPFSYGDERLDNQVAVAMANNYGIDERGNVRQLANLPEGAKTIYEMFSVNEDGEVSMNLPEGVELEDVLFNFRQAVRAANLKIKGTITPDSTAAYQRTLIGSLLGQFKTWMPGIIAERFGGLRYNDQLDIVEGGRYRLLWQEMTPAQRREGASTALVVFDYAASMIKTFLKISLLNNGLARKMGMKYTVDEDKLAAELSMYKESTGDDRMTLNGYKQLKEAQLRAVAMEVQVAVILAMMLFAMSADYDDDGEPLYKENAVFRMGYKILNRVRTEMAFTFNPREYSHLFTSPVPLVGLLNKSLNLIENSADELRDITFGENNPRDKTDAFHYSLGFIPAGYQLRRTFDLDFGPVDR